MRSTNTCSDPDNRLNEIHICLYILQNRLISVCVCIIKMCHFECVLMKASWGEKTSGHNCPVWMVSLGLFWLLSSFCPPRICSSICRLTLFSRPVQGIFMVIYRFRRDRYSQTLGGKRTERVCEFNDKFKNDETECHFICWCFCRF